MEPDSRIYDVRYRNSNLFGFRVDHFAKLVSLKWSQRRPEIRSFEETFFKTKPSDHRSKITVCACPSNCDGRTNRRFIGDATLRNSLLQISRPSAQRNRWTVQPGRREGVGLCAIFLSMESQVGSLTGRFRRGFSDEFVGHRPLH